MRTPSSNIDFSAILAKLQAPSCAERAVAVTPERLAAWAGEMATHGYRHTEATLEALRLYLAGYGLIMFGNCGTGKTFFFSAIGKARTAHGMEAPLVYPLMDTVGRKVDEVREWFIAAERHEVVLDDIGAEPTFNEYGNRWDILPWLLEMRLAASGRTHFTTNLKPAELRNRYGVRVVDRLNEMAAQVTLDGKSNRRTKPNAAVVRATERAIRAAEAKKPKPQPPELPK